MLGLHVKRGVESTLERVFKSSNNKFGKLDVHWNGTTAGINFSRNFNADSSVVDATVIFPNIDENANVDNGTFTNLIGYSIHELGHAWFTTNAPWDKARTTYGAFLGGLINGLEDPRIERKVIESGYAPNARVLFENLTNSILKKSGYVQPDDKKNIPFLLAIEGRRLNGYSICFPSITDASPYAKHLHWALNKAHKAKDTASIVKIAIELFQRLKEQDANNKPDEPGKPSDKPSDEPSDKPSDEPSDKPGDDNPVDDEGEGQPTDLDGSEGGSNGSEGGSNNEPTDKPGYKPSSGKSFEGGREVEPNEFIKDILKSHSSSADSFRPRPSASKPTYTNFNWI